MRMVRTSYKHCCKAPLLPVKFYHAVEIKITAQHLIPVYYNYSFCVFQVPECVSYGTTASQRLRLIRIMYLHSKFAAITKVVLDFFHEVTAAHHDISNTASFQRV